MAIFESAADLRRYMIDQDIFDYHELISDFDIDVVYTDTMPSKFLGYAVPDIQTIFIRTHLSEIGQQFIEAHEVTHVLLGSETAAFYHSSYVSNRKTELKANYGAFFILLRTYLNVWGISKSNFDIDRFLNYYEIPGMYYFQAQSFIEHHATEIFA